MNEKYANKIIEIETYLNQNYFKNMESEHNKTSKVLSFIIKELSVLTQRNFAPIDNFYHEVLNPHIPTNDCTKEFNLHITGVNPDFYLDDFFVGLGFLTFDSPLNLRYPLEGEFDYHDNFTLLDEGNGNYVLKIIPIGYIYKENQSN